MKNTRIVLFLTLILMSVSCQKLESAPAVVVQGKEVLPHPRLLFTSADEKALKLKLKTVPLLDSLHTALLVEADKLLLVPLQEYKLRDVNYVQDILMISREQVYRMITLSLAYRLSNDQRYLQKAEKELVHVCNFPNWNPEHYLDVAEMTTAVAIAYDWLYNDLTKDTKELIVESIRTKALDHALSEYAKGGPGSWGKRETNWNVVCNTGMVMGAMAIAEEYPDVADQIIQNAVKYVPNCLKHLAPDGVCYEGPAYWGYTNMYLSLLLTTLNGNLGHDFGLSALKGINRTALYYVHSTSPSGKVFNFANSGGTSPDTNPIYFFFSRHFNQPEVADCYRNIVSSRLKESTLPRWFFFLSLPWFDNAPCVAVADASPLAVYKGINDIAVFKGDKKVPGSIYLIAKGGDPDEAHQQLDLGTFVVETNGIRWSDDLGADNYALPGFWDYKPEGKRWHYFRNTNFSHNTLSIDGKIQNSAGTAKIVKYDDKAKEPSFTIDMTSAYDRSATSVLRTFCLKNDATVEITDNVSLLLPEQEICWSMITSAKIECKGKEAVLLKDGQTFHLKILSPDNATFSSKPAKTFTENENPVVGYELLQVLVAGKRDQTITISMGSGM